MAVLDLTLAERTALLKLARDSLVASFSSESEKPLKNFHPTPAMAENFPCFVTLLTKGHRLRGCVGAMATYDSLYKNVFHFARQAAFEDPRFDAMERQELAGLAIEITVIGPMKSLPSIADLKIGKHGLFVRQGDQHGVLLAHVATEYGWSPEEFIKQTCIKASLSPKDWKSYEWQYFDEVAFRET